MTADEASLLDFLAPYKFTTTFTENGVEHTYGSDDVAMGMSGMREAEDRSTELWINVECIGRGGFGTVLLQKELVPSGISRRARAVKTIDRRRTENVVILRELRSMIVARDGEHIVDFFGWYEDKLDYYIVMEYAEHGDLSKHIMNLKPALEETKEITYQILMGLTMLHDKGICHRDLKPQNVLVTSLQPIHVKLADFGVSKCDEGTELRTKIGTEGYKAPELLGTLPLKLRPRGSNSYTKAVDIWALGCIVYNLLTLEVPFLAPASVGEEATTITNGIYQRELDLNLLCQYCNGKNHILTGSLQRLGVAGREILFLNQFLVVDPKSRVSSAAALKDPWFLRPPHTQDHDIAFIEAAWNDNALIEAARDGRIDLLYISLSAGANVRGTDDKKNTALHLAAMNGHYIIVKTLLGHDVDLEAVGGEQQRTALHLAAFRGHKHVVRLLIEKGADLSAVESDGHTPLHLAAFQGHKDAVRLLIEMGADVTAVQSDRYTPLHMAASLGHKDVVQILIEKGADLSAVQSDGHTPLHLAACLGHKDVVRLLIEKGADLSAVESGGRTPLHLAAPLGHKDVVRLLIEKGADVSAVDSDGNTPLHMTASLGHKDVVRLLIEKGADLSAVKSNGRTPLHLAAPLGHKDVVRLLIEKGADVSAVDSNGHTPLHLAACLGQLDVMRLLIEMGADVTAVESGGHTPLHLAACLGHKDIVRLLIEKGADVSAVESNGRTPLHMAAPLGHKDVVRLLIEKGADLSAVESNGHTPLHLAASMGHKDVVRLLIEMGADLSAVESGGRTPLHLAASMGHLDVMRLLIEMGADFSAVQSGGHTPLNLAAFWAMKKLFGLC